MMVLSPENSGGAMEQERLYVLLDTRYTSIEKSVRYIGRSKEPNARGHTGDTTPGPKRDWVLELRALGLRPEVVVLGPGTHTNEAELIRRLRGRCRLVNIAGGDISWWRTRWPTIFETAVRQLTESLGEKGAAPGN